jgi:hypothetical protein
LPLGVPAALYPFILGEHLDMIFLILNSLSQQSIIKRRFMLITTSGSSCTVILIQGEHCSSLTSYGYTVRGRLKVAKPSIISSLMSCSISLSSLLSCIVSRAIRTFGLPLLFLEYLQLSHSRGIILVCWQHHCCDPKCR